MNKTSICKKHGKYISENIATVANRIIWTKCPKCVQELLNIEIEFSAKIKAIKADKCHECLFAESGLPCDIVTYILKSIGLPDCYDEESGEHKYIYKGYKDE